ncbi:hypothetical protein C4K05_1949 [Pseudomonas chlororaphis subsp. aureofaciens]|uniref:Uncharacterized protein n=1 Tax=Pseudomonas chlororaphis subsp. aureofaciens TaxID=587851 RepID=A0AAD0ZH68_9PSED|nr:hypothetical protein C4K19_1975 [Pseudomonas chlororaphis subsp. aurantiaca]AZD91374.1 hypothetical protein C4K13_1947 [Pseudomonas chlororaphis subsp. aureofaciens]AZE22368.1 hypothetical protein C4K08_1931 [Pseudomonas chlororaphis subsp. aureofaciens]AZE28720.1 hypothetical protein C4K07_1925 [Pseudomonas chlororaphis subsp. aureofaciens]AZE34965.1 hypothetical protein C4K06_1922 [Pseudomonas chlororaphis subsp. aureofaciens]
MVVPSSAKRGFSGVGAACAGEKGKNCTDSKRLARFWSNL